MTRAAEPQSRRALAVGTYLFWQLSPLHTCRCYDEIEQNVSATKKCSINFDEPVHGKDLAFGHKSRLLDLSLKEEHVDNNRFI